MLRWKASLKPASAVSNILIEEDFEGTGTPNGWTVNAGSPNFDYTTTVIDGSESLYLSGTTPRTTVAFTPLDEHWGYFRFRCTAFANTPFLWYNGSGLFFRCRILTNGKIRIYNGSSELATSGASFSINTTYNLWWRAKKGTGSNAEIDVFISTSTTKPSLTVGSSAGTQTWQTTGMVLDCGASGAAMTYDSFLVSDSEIGDNPWGL